MLTPFPLTIDNILNWMQQLLKILIVRRQNFCLWSLGASKSGRQTCEYACKMFLKRFTCLMRFIQRLSNFHKICGGFGGFLTSPRRDQSIVNILSICCYHRHPGVVEAAQIPATIDHAIDNILTIDGSSNCCNNIFDFLGEP